MSGFVTTCHNCDRESLGVIGLIPIKYENPKFKISGFRDIKPIPPKILRHNCVISSQNMTLHHYSETKKDSQLIFVVNSDEGARSLI